MGAQAVRLSNADIDNALKNRDFEVLFQPIFDLGNGALARMESFVRWRHRSLGVLPPGAFISFFESQGRMGELTRYVLGQALERYIGWRGPYAPGISINLALSDLSDDAFASHLTVLLREHEFPADLITLECPMPPVTASLGTCAENFKRLSATGARLAIEVRGRANDLLRELDPFPFVEIKTGGAAILRFARTVRGPGLSAISELLDIAGKANAAITAVGVEDQASLSALRGLGFTAAQGNHLGKVGRLKDFLPSRVNEVRELLDLDPLSQDDLASLFRTGAPKPKPAAATWGKRKTLPAPAATSAKEASAAKAPAAKKPAAKKPAVKKAAASAGAGESSASAQRKRKAAAIARAKKKAADATKKRAPADQSAKKTPAVALADASISGSSQKQPPAARKLQERLSEAFPERSAGPKETGGAKRASRPPAPRAASGAARPAAPPDDLFGPVSDEPAGPNAETAAPSAKDESIQRKKAGAAAPAKFEPASSAENAQAERSAADKDDKATTAAAPEIVEADLVEERSVSVAAEAAGGALKRATLAVGRAAAYFRPVLRVAGPSFEPPARPPEPRPEPPIEVAEDDASEIVEVFLDDEPDAPEAPPRAPHPESFHDSLKGDLEQTDIVFEETNAPDDAVDWRESEEPRAPARRRRKRKNFLMRRYRIWPDHFWPKSWKRAWRRHKAANARRAAEDF